MLINVPGALVDRLDAHVERLRAEVPGGQSINRAGLIRSILERWCDEHEAASPSTPKRRR